MENWVQLRHECSPLQVFTGLYQAAQTDVEQIRKIHEGNHELEFVFCGNGEAFTVSRKGPVGAEPWVTRIEFRMIDNGVCVKRDEEIVGKATLTLTDDLECKLKLRDGTELNSWQFRKRFLEDLFFNIYP